jgi:ketosteroid isomerase-like protein
MSEENVEIVRRSFELVNEVGTDAFIGGNFWSDDWVFDPSGTGIPGLGVYRGHDEIRAFFEEDWFTTFPFEEWEIHISDLVDHGDRVIGISHQQGRGASSGVAATLELANVFTLRDGQIVRVQLYRDRGEALEAAGLQE